MALDFPDSPAVGDLYGSPGVVWRWDGEVWSSTSGASGPRGALGLATLTTGIPVAEGGVDLLQVSFNIIPGRTYKVTAHVYASSTVSGDLAGLSVVDAVGSQQQSTQETMTIAGHVYKLHLEWVFTGVVATSYTVKARGSRSYGTGAMTISAGTAYPGFLLVEDITYEAGTSVQPTLKVPKAYTADFATGPRNDNGPMIDLSPILLPASVTGKAQLSFSGECYNALTAMGWALIFDVPDAPTMPYSAHLNQHRIAVPEAGTVPVNNWYSYSSGLLWTPITAGVIPNLRLNVFVGSPGQEWYMSCRVGVLEIPA